MSLIPNDEDRARMEGCLAGAQSQQPTIDELRAEVDSLKTSLAESRAEQRRVVEADDFRIRDLEAEVESLRGALEEVVYELAALIPKPASPAEADWPVENPADAKCLQLAYVAARAALGRDA